MRIVAGSARGRRLQAPAGTDVRPTSDRVREAVFNALGSLAAIDGSRALDLFAGSGALGLEALSRGAERVDFVERDRTARSILVENLDRCGFADQARVVAADAEVFLAESTGQWDLVLLDPPYAFERWAQLLVSTAPHCTPGSVVVIESNGPVAVPPGWVVEREKRYSGTLVAFARPPSPPREPC